MEDGVNTDNNSNAMGATSNNTAKRAVLEERKKQLEESLLLKNQELRELCIQELELTGVTPPEMPLKPGETQPEPVPILGRYVPTTYQLNENLAGIELQIQLHAKKAEAALKLAKKHNISKFAKRQYNTEYREHKSQCIALQEKLTLLKEQQIRKKKTRYSDVQVDDNISVSTVTTDGVMKHESTHTLRSLKANSVISTSNDSVMENRYNPNINKNLYRTTDIPYFENYVLSRNEEALASGFYRLSLNGYSKYMERFETITSPPYNRSSQYNTLQPQNLQYNLGLSHSQNLGYNNTLPSQHYYQHPSPHLSDSSPHLSQHSPLLSHHSPHISHQHSPQLQRNSPQLSHSPLSQHSVMHRLSQNSHYNMNTLHNINLQNRQPSPTASPSFSTKYYPQHNVQEDVVYRHPSSENVMSYKNPHQLQPHQQYEHNSMTPGLGGCWKRLETGELFWCNSSTLDSTWQKDKHFGSLDRRKNKKLPKRISPVDNKCATIGSSVTSSYQNQVRSSLVNKPSQVKVGSRRSQDHRQLVRTQSLGSVGAQTIDSVYPSDDNSSCESDNKSISGNRFTRRNKEKEWLESSLDGPISPSHSIASHTQPVAPTTTVLAPEEKYSPSVVPTSPTLHIPRSITPKAILEIPAESNPSPRIPETSFEMYNINNNILKNCTVTVVEAGQCKPYHEETKPFEMSDFYKYSTKFKKSPVKAQEVKTGKSAPHGALVERSLKSAFDESFQKKTLPSPQHPFNSINNNMDVIDKPGSLNVSIDLSHIGVSEHFSAEMNAWYNEHEDPNTAKNSRSTATLV